MTLQVSTFCEENNIILYLLPPNTTHILQPADVVPFKNLKSLWRQAVHQFQLKNPNQVVRRKDVAVLLKSILNEITSESIKSGFRVTGLYPFNVEAVDFTKCLDIEIEQDPVSDSPLPSSTPSSSTSSEDKYQNAMAVLEELIGIDEVKKCKDGEVCSVTMNEYFNLLNKKCNPDSNTFNEILLENIPIIDIGSSNEEVIDIQIITEDNAQSLTEVLPELSFTSYLSENGSSFELNTNEPKENTNSNSTPPYIIPEVGEVTDPNIPPLKRSNAFSLSHLSSSNISDQNDLGPILSQNPSTSRLPSLVEYNPSTNTESAPSVSSITDVLMIPSTSTTPPFDPKEIEKDYKFWDGKLVLKKRKEPVQRRPSILSGSKYRKFYFQEESKKKKKNGSDWICSYCNISWSEDKKKKRDLQWIECDQCDLKMHTKCIPTSHKNAVNLLDDIDGETDFLCEGCW